MNIEMTQVPRDGLGQNERTELSILWADLVKHAKVGKKVQNILGGISGRISSGEMVAVLGPSGSGKSTLLKHLVGILTPDGGVVKIETKFKPVSLSFVPQFCDLSPQLTVKEYLNFATAVKLGMHNEKRVEEMICAFSLNRCEETRVSLCSGGEQRRLALALEVTSRPDILIADEATTGLDSFTALKIISVLKELTLPHGSSRRSAVIVTVHQPSWDMCQLFDRVFVLCKGQYMYAGGPKDIIAYLNSLSLKLNLYLNPMDYLMEIATGEHGAEKQNVLLAQNHVTKSVASCGKVYDVRQAVGNNDQLPITRTFLLILQRMTKSMCRDPQQYLGRLLLCVGIPAVITVCRKTSAPSPCLYVEKPENVHERTSRMEMVLHSSITLGFNAFIAYFGTIITTYFTSCEVIATAMNEQLNNWYSLPPCFLAWSILNMISTFTLSVANVLTFFARTEIIQRVDQLLLLSFLVFLPCMCFSLIGFNVAVVFYSRRLVGIIVGITILAVMFELSGFVVTTHIMIRPVWYAAMMNPARMGLETFVITLYSPNCSLQHDYPLTFEQAVDFSQVYKFKTDGNISALTNIPPKLAMSMVNYQWTPNGVTELLTAMNDLNSSQVDSVKSFWNNRLNFILDELNLHLADIPVNVYCLITATVLLHFVSYVSLRLKSRL